MQLYCLGERKGKGRKGEDDEVLKTPKHLLITMCDGPGIA
jgi:hypothetical protein